MALMQIDQEGLEPGVPGVARSDGVMGHEVTLTDIFLEGQSKTKFEILWAADNASIATLRPSDTSEHVWVFTPGSVGGGDGDNGSGNPIRIRLTHSPQGGPPSTQTRIFGIKNAAGVVPPAPGERADPNATLINAADPEVIDRCERNWPTDKFPAGNPFGWSGDLINLLYAAIQAFVANQGTSGNVTYGNVVDAIFSAGNILLDNAQITGAADPVAPQDVATKAYVDRSAARRYIDVAVATEKELPNYSVGQLQNGQEVLEGTGALTVDGFTLVPGTEGALILVLWEGQSVGGVYEVANPGNEEFGWRLGLRYRFGVSSYPAGVGTGQPLAPASMSTPLDVYRVQFGGWFGGRQFVFNPETSQLSEISAPLQMLRGSTAEGAFVYPGKLLLIDANAGDLTFLLHNYPHAVPQNNMRIGFKIVAGVHGAIITPPSPILIESPVDGESVPAVTLTGRGTYAEWIYDHFEGDGLWRLLSLTKPAV